MSAPPRDPLPCPWCGYDVSWLPKDMVCPECGGRQSRADFAFAAESERNAWRKTWVLILLAPGCGVWLGLVLDQFAWVFGGVHPALIASMPVLLWLVAALVLVLEPWGRGRVVVQSVRRRQQWLFALVAGGSLVLAAALVWAWLEMATIVSLLGTVNINVTHALLTLLISLFGMGSGLLWALPLMRAGRVPLKRS